MSKVVAESGREWIAGPYRHHVTTQSYGPKRRIEGVELIDLPLFSDEGGDFCEITRFASDGALSHLPTFRPAQISYSFMEPGAIKAWHLHQRQNDLWFVPPGQRVLVGMFDLREASLSYEITMRFTMGVGKARLLYIPKGVAHGVANLGPQPVSLIYFVDQPFDPNQPDEHRLPYDLLGAQFWMIQPG